MMYTRTLARGLLAAAFLGSAAACVDGQQGSSSTTAFVNITVVPMDADRVLPGQTVVVAGDRIIEVGPSADVDVPTGATQVDGRGKYLMPGLSEMHGHTAGGNATDEFRRQVMFLYAANGVTTVRGMLGIPGDLELKSRTNTGEIWGPTLYLAGPSFNGNTVTSPEQAAARVWEQKNEGWDHLKIHPGLTVPQYDALARAAQATRRYAKRQLTWFRKTPDIHWFDPDAEALEGSPSARLNRLIADVRRFLAGDPLALDWEADPP